MTNKCIIFDADGTLCDLSHRLHFLKNGKEDWVSFSKYIPNDSPIHQMIYLNNLISGAFEGPLFIVTGRSEPERNNTEQWFKRYGVVYDRIFMRPAGDTRADHIIKFEILQHIRSLGYEPWVVFDDRQSVVDMWRKEGIYVLQPCPNSHNTTHDQYRFHNNVEFPLTIMVGPSGAGKSTYASVNYDNSWIISSDKIREELFGDFKSQEDNSRVFDVFHSLAETRLKGGLPVVLDATHIKNADRKKSALLVPSTIPVNYVVVNRPLRDKIETAGWRAGVEVKGTSLIEYHDNVFRANHKDIMNGDGLDNVKVTTVKVN